MSSLSAEKWSDLAGDLGRAGYIRGLFGPEGSSRTTWFETELVVTRPGILTRCVGLLEKGVPERTDRLTARGAPALVLATALALQTWVPLLLWPENGAAIRPDPPDSDFSKVVEGELFPGARVVVVEDVVFTGRHALETIYALRSAGLEVIGLTGLLDREHEGRFRIEDEGVPTFFAFRERDLQAR